MTTQKFRPNARTVGTILLFFLIGFGVFGSSIHNEFVTWDDGGLIVENKDVSALNMTTLKHVFSSYDPELYIPLTFVSYQLNHLIAGDNPAIYHATNLVLHILNALLVCWLLTLLLGAGWLPTTLAVLFLVHPLNSEAVAWASARKDVLSTFFFLSSLIAYIRWRELRILHFFIFSLFLFLLGFFSKVMVITLPVVLLFFDVLEERRDIKKIVIEKLPFFILSGIFGIVALLGKTAILAASTPWQKILMASKSTIFYIEKFIAPFRLSVIYPYTKPITVTSPDFFVPLVLTIALLAITVWVWKKSRLVSFGLAFYLLTLVPTFTNFSKANDNYFASDRYAYIPMIGLLIALGAVLQHWLSLPRTARESARNMKTFAFSAAAVIGIFAITAHAQSLTWRTSEALYRNAIQYYPNSRAAHHNLGMELLLAGKPEDALAEFDIAESIKNDPRTRVSKGAALVALKRYKEATIQYESVIAMDPDEPDAYYGLGNIALKQGNLEEAIQQYKKAIEADPTYTNAINNLGAIYIKQADWDNAIATLRKAIDINPDFPESYYNLAGAEERKGLLVEAEADYRKAIALSPYDPDALASLATMLYKQQRVPEAAELLKSALSLNQENSIGLALLSQMQRDGMVR